MSKAPKFIELGEVKVGQALVVKRQEVWVVALQRDGEKVTIVGETREGAQVVYQDYPDALVQVRHA